MPSLLRTGISGPPESSAVRIPWHAIRFLGKCLSYRDIATMIADVRASLANERTDWPMIAAVANRHAITPALWAAINRKQLADLVPTDVSAYLELLYNANRQRNRLVREQTLEVVRSLNHHGIDPILMKSVLTLFEVGCDEGASIMSDVDLLVAQRELPRAISAMRSLGYDLLFDPPAYAHASTFHRPMSLATVDLHCDIGPQRALLTPAAASTASEPISRSDVAMSGLAVSHRVLLLVMNFGVFERDYLAGHIPMKGLQDLAGLCHRRGREIDWEYVFRTTSDNDIGAQAAAFFHMASELMGIPVPIYPRQGGRAQRYLNQCALLLAYPTFGRVARAYAQVAWPFDRIRMDYRHHCGTRGTPLAAARVRHVIEVLRRRNSLRAWRAMVSRQDA